MLAEKKKQGEGTWGRALEWAWKSGNGQTAQAEAGRWELRVSETESPCPLLPSSPPLFLPRTFCGLPGWGSLVLSNKGALLTIDEAEATNHSSI